MTDTDVTALRIVARSMVRELTKQGYSVRHVVALANELIGLACEYIRSNQTQASPPSHHDPDCAPAASAESFPRSAA